MSSPGKRLIEAMRARGYTKNTALAAEIGVTDSAITRWTKSGNIKITHAVKVAKALNLSLDWWLAGIGPIDSPKIQPGFSEHESQTVYLATGVVLSERSISLLNALVDSINLDRQPT